MAYERESLIEKHLVAEVKKAGGVAFKFVSPGRRSVPDRIVLLPGGRIVFVECKSPGKPPRPDQLRTHERLRKLGFTVVVLDSKELGELFPQYLVMVFWVVELAGKFASKVENHY
ncbi:VRR-NUC domain-containing protein [Escherichia coli]|uniref:VRR-NUC domain-containing protein n=1 Tax=Escherichia coli TaxID=562 RepID=UPI00201DB6C2|nr:VRR-NUC domain-containing protein [Escherichia coli]